MNYLKLEAAVFIVRRLKLVSEFVPGVGAKCTFCGEWARAETGGKILKSGGRKRYHLCPKCGYKFSSLESS